jgi:hypothetical protein
VKTYDIYLHSGPQMKKTYAHVPSLMGCIWLRDTTPAAVDAADQQIHAYLDFLERAGEKVDPKAAFRTSVAQHDTSGGFIGSSFLPTDAAPLPKPEAEALMRRLAALHGEIRRLTGGLPGRELDAKPAAGRPIRGILSHVCAEGSYLRGVSGASRIQREVHEGRLDANDALDRLHALELDRLRTMDDGERSAVVVRGQSSWSVRSAVRRMLEHAWEHYVEIGARLGPAP